MTAVPGPGDAFPDLALPDHRRRVTRLSDLVAPSALDHHLGFGDGSPLILVFYRGFFCPRDGQQMRALAGFQDELRVNYARLACVSVDPPPVAAAYRAGLGATWPFLSDEDRSVVRSLGLLDDTEGEYAFRSRPSTFVLRPDLRVHRAYDGWYFVGRPTLEELRRDLREVMSGAAAYPYEAWTTPEVRAVRVPQQTWEGGGPQPGESGRPVLKGVVAWFDLTTGNGAARPDGMDEEVFFNFTAIPGEGDRTLPPGARVRFEIVEGPHGRTAWNVRQEERGT